LKVFQLSSDVKPYPTVKFEIIQLQRVDCRKI